MHKDKEFSNRFKETLLPFDRLSLYKTAFRGVWFKSILRSPDQPKVSLAKMKSIIAVLLLTLVRFSNAACPNKCEVTLLSRFPETGYRASINLKAPRWYKPMRPFLISLVFDGDLKMVENLHIPGGSLKPKLSNLTKNELKLRFRPDQAIKKGSQVNSDISDIC